MSAPLRTFRVYFRDIEVGIMDVEATNRTDARTKAWALFNGIGDLPTRSTETIIERLECLDEAAPQMSLPRQFNVVLNVPSAVTVFVTADTEQEACHQALERFLANPRLFKRQELGDPTILHCEQLSQSEDPA